MKMLLIALMLTNAATASFGQAHSLRDLQGYWIPAQINWKTGDFSTLYFYNDTSFIRVTTTQSKNKNGTINCMTDNGFTLEYGKCKWSRDERIVTVDLRLLHRGISLSGEKIPGNLRPMSITWQLTNKSRAPRVVFDHTTYVKTKRYTTSSQEQLSKVATQMVPAILRENHLTP